MYSRTLAATRTGLVESGRVPLFVMQRSPGNQREGNGWMGSFHAAMLDAVPMYLAFLEKGLLLGV
jgi:hypothetical protein